MTTTPWLIALTISLSIGPLASFAQQAASAYVSATVVTPISITPANDLDFGNIAVQSSSGGTVVIQANGSRLATGGITLPANSGNPAAAAFNIEGEEGFVYDIALPTSPVILIHGSGSMSITDFTSNPQNTGQLSSGAQSLYVGGTLHIAGDQPPGTYISVTPFTVTVNYN